MSKYGTDENGWPLVPVEPAAIPEGYEAVRVGFPRAGEIAADVPDGDVIRFAENWNADAYLIVRPIPKPIQRPLSIVPHGWWVVKDYSGVVWCYEYRPQNSGLHWSTLDGAVAFEKLPPWIAAQLPREWRDLPWDQSAVQQTEGGEG